MFYNTASNSKTQFSIHKKDRNQGLHSIYNASSFCILNVTFSQRCEHKCKRIHILLPHCRRVNEIDMKQKENGEREREREKEREKIVCKPSNRI